MLVRPQLLGPLGVVFLPLVGLILVPILPRLSPYPVSGQTFVPFGAYLLFYAIFVASLFGSYRLSKGWRWDRLPWPKSQASAPTWSVPFVSAALFLFMATQVDFAGLIHGEIYKGDLRVGGQVFSVITKFVLPCFFAYTCLVWRSLPSGQQFAVVLLTGFFAFASAFLLGTKLGAVMAVLPGALALSWRGLSLWTVSAWAVIVGLFVLAATVLFDGMGGNSLSYMTQRAFIMSAEIPYRLTEPALRGASGIDYSKTLLAPLTNTVLRHMIDDPQQIFRYSFSGAASGVLYPDRVPLINTGEWNHTPPVFFEGVVALGPFFGFFAILAGGIGGTIVRLVDQLVYRKLLLPCGALLTYFVFVYMAWLNSSGIGGLVHPFPLGAIAIATVALWGLGAVERGTPALFDRQRHCRWRWPGRLR